MYYWNCLKKHIINGHLDFKDNNGPTNGCLHPSLHSSFVDNIVGSANLYIICWRASISFYKKLFNFYVSLIYFPTLLNIAAILMLYLVTITANVIVLSIFPLTCSFHCPSWFLRNFYSNVNQSFGRNTQSVPKYKSQMPIIQLIRFAWFMCIIRIYFMSLLACWGT